MQPTSPRHNHKTQIELVERNEAIDDNDWADWFCLYSTDGGETWEHGNIQSDGIVYALGTLTDDGGDKIE